MQQWELPVILLATPERQESEKASSCSLVAQHLWASIFRQANHPFEIVYGDPADGRARSELARAISLCRAAERLSRAKLGAIGGNAPGFLAMAPDTFAMQQKLGVQLAMVSLTQFIERVKTVDDAAARSDVARVTAMKLPMRGVSNEDLPLQSKYYVALRRLIEEEGLDAISIQDWPELPNDPGQWPYLAIARLADEGVPVGMEGDADGAILCLIAKHLQMGAGFITDWLEHDDQTITFWHAGTAPPSMCTNLTLTKHFNIERAMVLDGTLRTNEPVTVARLWRCDGGYHMTAFEGRTIPMRRTLTGNSGLVEVEGGGVSEWFDALCHAGFPHHPVVFYGRHRTLLRRMARLLRVNWIEKP
jgi:L-fucose isomerase-like protein